MIKPVAITALALALATGGALAAKGGKAAKPAADETAPPALSKQAKENPNRNNDDKEKGLDRAQERMSEQGLEHSKSDEAQQAHKKTKKPKKK